MAATRASALTNVYADTFESYPEGTPLVDGTNYWYASSTNVIVQTNTAASGSTNAAMVPTDATLSNRFDQITSPTNVWLHLEAKPVRYDATNHPVVGTNEAAFFYLNSNGFFVAYDGSASNWVTITQRVDGVAVSNVPLNTWTNLDVFMDYSVKKWQIVQGTNLLTTNLGFANTNLAVTNGFIVDNGATTTYLDNVYIYDHALFVEYEVRPKTFTTDWVMHGYTNSLATQSFDIVVTAGLGIPAFTITTNGSKPWITVTPGAGTLTNVTNTIALNFSTNALNVGIQTAIFDVVTDVGAGVTDQVTVVVKSVSQPTPALSWTNYAQPPIHKGVQPVMTNLFLSNNAATPRSGMRYDVTSDSAWLLAATNGVCTNGESHAITVQFITNMTTYIGSYTGILTIQTWDTTNTTVYTPVGTITSTMYVTVQVSIIGVGTPTGLTASDGTDTGGIQLNWSATTNVNHYEVWRANTNILASATLIGTATNLTYYDTTVNPGFNRWYWLRAVNDYGGDGDFSVPAMGWRFLPAPTGLTATSGLYTNRVALSWTGSFGAVNYEIWRSIYTNVGLASLLGTVFAAVTTYDDTTGDAILTYYYWVRACTPDRGNYSDSANGYRAALLTPNSISASKGTFNSKIRVLWQAVDAAIKYEVWRSTDTNLSNAVQIGTVTIRGYDDTQASVSQIFYYYWIRARNAQGFASPFSDLDSGWVQLAPPVNVAATQGTRPYSVRISWNPVENATSYEVVRTSSQGLNILAQSLVGSTPLAAIAPSLSAGIFTGSELTQTFWDDNATFAGASYLYEVRAKNARGISELSGAANGWRQVLKASTTKKVANDYDGDKLADVVLFNTDDGLWRILCSMLGELPVNYGDATCVPVPGDYDGDGLADPMIYSAAQSYWQVLLSSIGYAPIQADFGGPGQLAAVADYDNDGLTDPAVFDPATGNITVALSKSGYVCVTDTFSDGPGYVPVSANFDGDGLADPAVYSATNGLLRVKLSTAGYDEVVVSLGGIGMIFVPGDFDGDGKSELTTYNESTGILAVGLSSAEYLSVDLALGGSGYAWVVPADYDGDGLLDPAVYSQTNGWMIMFSSLGYATQTDTFSGVHNLPFVP